MFKICILFVCILSLSAKDATADGSQTTSDATKSDIPVGATESDAIVNATESETTVSATESDATVSATECETTVSATESDRTVSATECDTTVSATECDTTVSTTECDTTVSATECETTVSATVSDATVSAIESSSPTSVTDGESKIEASTSIVNVRKDKLFVNGTVEGVDTDGALNGTVNDVVKANKETMNDKALGLNEGLDFNGTSSTIVVASTKAENETFVERVEAVMKRLFKRDLNAAKGDGIVGSLVRRGSEELAENQKITVPMICQAEYYQLRLRKQEIEKNKNIWRHKDNMTEHEELIQETWEKLVNWSQDHIRFEKKVIQMHKLKMHDKLQRTKEIDSDDEPDSDDELRSVDPDEDSDKSLPPEFATVKNLAEVNERYQLEKDIADIERKIREHPKEEDNEKNRLLLEQYRTDLKLVDLKYERIKAMKLNREFVENLWKEKNMLHGNKKEKDSDDDEK